MINVVFVAPFFLRATVQFIEGAVGEVTLPEADAYYLFNPFGENLMPSYEYLDVAVELGEDRYVHDVTYMERFLEEAPRGTYVIKYNGFGGRMPETYEAIRVDREMPSVLRLWQKVRP